MSVRDDATGTGERPFGSWRYRPSRLWADWSRHPAFNIVLVFVAIQIGCIAAWLIFPHDFRYLEWLNLESMMRAIPVLGIVAVGVGVLMICGEFDLSVGATYILTSYLMALAYQDGWPLPIAVLLAYVVAVVIGLGNGLITVIFRIPSFITTLGSMMFLRGVIRFASNSQAIIFMPGRVIQRVLAGSILHIQVQFLWFLAFAAVGYLVLSRHRLGNHIFMVGGNYKAAVAVGINAKRVKVVCFVFSAICPAFAGIMSATRISAIAPSGGLGLELQAIAACVVGGLSLFGGRGTAIGIALGAMLLFTIQDVLLLIRAPGYYLDMFIGAIIVVAVILNQWAAPRP